MGAIKRFFQKPAVPQFLTIILSFLVLGGIFVLFAKNINSLTDKIVLNRIAIAEQSKIIDTLATLRKDSDEADKNMEKFIEILQEEEDLVSFPGYIERVAELNQLSSTFAFRGGLIQPTETDPGQISFSVNVTGTINGIISFVEGLESKSKKYIINTNVVSVNAEGTGFRADVSGVVFFR